MTLQNTNCLWFVEFIIFQLMKSFFKVAFKNIYIANGQLYLSCGFQLNWLYSWAWVSDPGRRWQCCWGFESWSPLSVLLSLSQPKKKREVDRLCWMETPLRMKIWDLCGWILIVRLQIARIDCYGGRYRICGPLVQDMGWWMAELLVGASAYCLMAASGWQILILSA